MGLFRNPPKKKTAPAAPAVDTSKFVSRDDVQGMIREAVDAATQPYKETIGELRGTIETIRTTPAQPAQPLFEPTPTPAAPEITDDEIDDIIASGEKGSARKIRALINRAVSTEVDGVKTELERVKSFGLSTMQGMAKKAAIDDMKHYGRFQKEIDGAVAALAPEYQARPDVWKYIHDQIVGANFETLEREGAEQTARAATDSAAAGTPGTGSGKAANDPARLPTAEELAGAEGRKALAAVGKDGESLAKAMGYKDWNDYVTQAAESGLSLIDEIGNA
jgi:hypothetical protein